MGRPGVGKTCLMSRAIWMDAITGCCVLVADPTGDIHHELSGKRFPGYKRPQYLTVKEAVSALRGAREPVDRIACVVPRSVQEMKDMFLDIDDAIVNMPDGWVCACDEAQNLWPLHM